MWLAGTQNSLEEMVRNLPKGFEDQQAFWKFGTSLCTREERMLITNEDPPQKMQEYTLWRKWLLSSGQKYELATAPGPFPISKWGVEL